jgi:hypothetical protein
MVQPFGISLMYWAATLVQDFPDANVPILYNEEDWRHWGNFVVTATDFLDQDCPGTEGFSDWISWADAVYQCMIDQP